MQRANPYCDTHLVTTPRTHPCAAKCRSLTLPLPLTLTSCGISAKTLTLTLALTVTLTLTLTLTLTSLFMKKGQTDDATKAARMEKAMADFEVVEEDKAGNVITEDKPPTGTV